MCLCVTVICGSVELHLQDDRREERPRGEQKGTVGKPGLMVDRVIEMLQPAEILPYGRPKLGRGGPPACTRRKWRAISFLDCDFYFATKGEGVGQG